MLYLILPPIIIVIALIALVYFFTRRFGQVNEVLSEKSLSMDGSDLSDTGFIMSLKSWAIRVMERIAHWFKESSQAAHEKLQSLSQDVKEKKEKSALHMKNTLQQVQMARQAKQEKKASRADAKLSEKVAQPEKTQRSTDIAQVSTSTDRFKSLKNVVSKVRDLPKKESRIVSMRPTVSQKITQPEEKESEATETEETLPEVKTQLEDILVERIAANPRDLEAYERLGEYYMEQGNVQDAKECYRQVLRLSPVHRLAKIKIRRLEKMLEQK